MEIPTWAILSAAFLIGFGTGLGTRLAEYIFSKKKNANKLEIVVDRGGIEIIEKKRLQPIESIKRTKWEEE